MLLKNPGERFEHNGMTFVIGEGIYAVSSAYEGLYGVIVEIKDAGHKDTDNCGADIYCRFFPPINREVEGKIEMRMSSYYGDPVCFEDIAIDLIIMAPEMLRPTKKCRVYQLTEQGAEFMFRPYEHVKKLGLETPPGDVYRVVYDGNLHTDELEEIFYLLNCNHPDGYNGWSLSLSDIVELYDEKETSYYYCDTFGFQQVPFVPAGKEDHHA